jgi:hypothetical protein
MFDIFFSFDRMLERLKANYPDIEILNNIWEGVWGKKENKYDLTHANSNGYRIMVASRSS